MQFCFENGCFFVAELEIVKYYKVLIKGKRKPARILKPVFSHQFIFKCTIWVVLPLPVFEVQLGRFGLHGFELYGHMLVGVQVLPESKFSEVSTSDFLSDPKIWPDHEDRTGPGRGRSGLSHPAVK